MWFPCPDCLFGSYYPTLCICFPVCQGDSAALKMSEGALSPLSGHHSCQVTVDSNKSSLCQLHPRPPLAQLLHTVHAAKQNVWNRYLFYFALRHKTCQFSEREDRRSICSGYKSGNYSSSWKIYENLYLCERALHHCRYQNGCSHRFLACQNVCAVELCTLMNANYIFPCDWRQAGMCTILCVYMKTTARRSSKQEGVFSRLLVGLWVICLH